MVDTKELISHTSKGFIRDFNLSIPVKGSKKDSFEIFPQYSREKALSDIMNDETVKTSIITLTDKSMEYGYTINSVDNKSNLDSFKKYAKKVRFDKLLEKVFSNLYGFNNVFIENVKDGNNDGKELHILETTKTQPEATDKGEVTGYVQSVSGMLVQDYPRWEVDEVTHISIDNMSETIWSDISIQSIHKYILLKQYIYAYYGWFFGTNQKRSLINIKDGNDESVKSLLSYIKRMENDITKHIPFSGDIEKISLGDLNDADKALMLINKCDNNILKLMQVPAIAANETGDSNRSSGDSQDGHLTTRIMAVQKTVAEGLINDLFIKIGYPKIIISFNKPVKTNIEKLLDNVEKMKNIGFNVSVVEQYLSEAGFPIDGKLIDEEAFKTQVDKSIDNDKKGEDESSENIGTGEESTTREDQIHSKGFNSYPYRMD